MNSAINELVVHVAANVAAEGKAAAALTSLAAQVADLNSKLTAALANGLTQADTDALTKASTDLATSVSELSKATPA